MNNQDNEKVFQKSQINWFPGHMAKTKREISEKLNLIDIVYEVIDGRMPISSKIVDIDGLIKDKPRILVVTKMDLCDVNITNKWIEKYKNEGNIIVTCDSKNSNDYKKIINLVSFCSVYNITKI